MNKIIQEINGERATRKLPAFNPGDTVIVQVKVVEGDRERVQAYEGRCHREEKSRYQFVVHGTQDFARRRRRACVSNA